MKPVKTFKMLTKPIPLNNVYANKKKGGRTKTQRYRTWCNAVGWELKAQHSSLNPIVSGAYGLIITTGRKVTRADIDNIIKPIADALVRMNITPDDSKMEYVSVEKTDQDHTNITVLDMGDGND